MGAEMPPRGFLMSTNDDGYIEKDFEDTEIEKLQKEIEEHEKKLENEAPIIDVQENSAVRTLIKSNFPVPASEESGNTAVDTIEKKYQAIFSESMSAESRTNIYSFLTNLNIRPDDALCSALLCMQYYDNRLMKFPARLELTVNKVLQETRDECASAAADEAKKVKKEILRMMNDYIENCGNSNSKYRTPLCISLYILFGFFLGQIITRLPFINNLLIAIYN